MATGNQNKDNNLDASLHLRVTPELKSYLVRIANVQSRPGHPVTASDVARRILEDAATLPSAKE